MEVKDEEYVHEAQVLEQLEELEDEEMTHEQKIAKEKLIRNIKIDDLGTIEELQKELEEIEALKTKHVYKLLEVVPQQPSTVRTMFSKERIKLEDEDVEQILEITQSIDTEN